jgi:hypothetical protein
MTLIEAARYRACATAKIAACIAIVVAAFAVQAQAHHSFAMFDQEKMITVEGTLKEFEWSNPHCWLHVNVVNPATGKASEWAFEMGSIGQIAAQGWKSDTVKAGDKIAIDAHPMKDGSRGGQYQAARLSDGRSFKQPPAAGR